MKLLFISLGCDKNLVDSESMIGILEKRGYTFTDDEEEAEVIVINTCCFINDAKEESIQTILQMAKYRESGSCRALIVTGCLAQRYREEITEEIPVLAARTRYRPDSTERRTACALCIRSAVESLNQESLVGSTMSSAPSRTLSRVRVS